MPNSHILTQNLYYKYPIPKYLIVGYMDPLGEVLGQCAMSFQATDTLGLLYFNDGAAQIMGPLDRAQGLGCREGL